MNVELGQAAADPRPSQTTWAVNPPVQAARVYTHHHRHLLLLLSPKADTDFTIPPTEGRRLSRPGWLVTYWDGLSTRRRSPILVLTRSDVAQLGWSRPTRYHLAKPPTKIMALKYDLEMARSWTMGQGSFKINENGTIWKLGYGFLFAFHSCFNTLHEPWRTPASYSTTA